MHKMSVHELAIANSKKENLAIMKHNLIRTTLLIFLHLREGVKIEEIILQGKMLREIFHPLTVIIIEMHGLMIAKMCAHVLLMNLYVSVIIISTLVRVKR
jgi:bifunctional DNase/RNase